MNTLKIKQIESLENSIKRRQGLLNNENYVSKAPKELVEQEQLKLQEETQQLEILKNSK